MATRSYLKQNSLLRDLKDLFLIFFALLRETLFFFILSPGNRLPSWLQSTHGQQLQRKYYRDALSALYNLESDWRDIVENSHMLSEKQTQQQTALWELAETEVAYIKTLKVVTDVSKVSTYFLLLSWNQNLVD